MSIGALDSYGNDILRRQFGLNQSRLDTALERLSSGLRINRAADDPVGITLASRSKTQLSSNRIAIDQNMQALNLTDVAADGAQQVLSQLQRLRELAVSSISDTNTGSDRSRIQDEVNTLVKAIGQIGEVTRFNSRQLIDGSSSGFQNFKRASGEIVSNYTYTSKTNGNTFNFLTGYTVDPGIDVNDTFTFRTSLNTSTNKYSLEVLSARQGSLLYYNDLDTSPTSFSFSLPTPTGSANVSINRSNFDFERITGPLTTAELNKTLQQLVNNDRLDPISYGNLQVQLGPNTHNIGISGDMTLQGFLNSLNGLSSGSNVLNAAYNTSTGRITLNYSGRAQNTTSNVTNYTVPTPTAAGGPYASYAAIPAASQGPAYRNISTFLPTTGFNVSTPQSNFPTLPTALDTSLSLTGTDSSILSAFGLTSTTGRGTVSAYTTSYYGETVATTTNNQYVNRTRVVIGSVTATQDLNGSTSSLTTADASKTFSVLNTAKVTSTALGAGDFSINFGTNGTFTFTGFDPNTHTIQNIVDRINNYTEPAVLGAGNVTASYDDNTDQLTINNTVVIGSDNSITFGGANGTAIANYFKLSNRPTNGALLATQSTVSSAPIDNGSVDASLELTATDRTTLSLNALRTPKLSSLVQGQLTINGQNIISINASTNTINDLVNAITNFSASNNRDYTANFNVGVTGGLRINTLDIETLANAASQPAANPNGASPTVTNNQLILDSAAYLANGATPFQQTTYASTALTPNAQNTPYVTTTPNAPANVAGISFSGASNLASVLFLSNAANNTPSVVAGSDEYQGTAVSTGFNTFQLTGNQRRTFQASSTTTSSQRLGYDTSAIDESDLPSDGIIGEVKITPQTRSRTTDHALNLVIDGASGRSLRLSLEDLSPRALRLENLTLYREGDSDLLARLRGENALNILDKAIDSTLTAMSRIGAGQRVLDSALEGLQSRQVQLSDTLSSQQDADLPTEISNMTRAQLNIQASASLLAQRQNDAKTLYGLLFGFNGRDNT